MTFNLFCFQVSPNKVVVQPMTLNFCKVSPNKVVAYEVSTGGMPEPFLCTETIWPRIVVVRIWTRDFWVPRRTLHSLGHTALHSYNTAFKLHNTTKTVIPKKEICQDTANRFLLNNQTKTALLTLEISVGLPGWLKIIELFQKCSSI